MSEKKLKTTYTNLFRIRTYIINNSYYTILEISPKDWFV